MAMPKRAFNNLSNLQIHVEDGKVIGLKRPSQDVVCPVANKKSRSDININNNINNNNAGAGKIKASKGRENISKNESVTKTIERKVKSISLRPKPIADVKVIQSVDSSNEKDVIADCSINQSQEEKTDSLVQSPKPLRFDSPTSHYQRPPSLPADVEDYDLANINDLYSESMYAYEIFEFYKQVEVKFLTKKYMHQQNDINKNMRAVLIDWLVEVQQNYTLNHETLYLAVKIIDRFLMTSQIKKSNFQLLGVTALLIASKYDERRPPVIDDFVYSCDNLYEKRQVILEEINILQRLDFYLGFPLSYRFLRRFARVDNRTLEELTLARYILESSLMEYDLIEERESRIAAAALLLSIKMVAKRDGKICVEWSKKLEFYSSYKAEDLLSLVYQLNKLLLGKEKLSAIRNKYSHAVFLSVAKIAPLTQP